MQQAFRAARSVKYGGASIVASASRGIHSTAVNPNPAIIVAESRHSTETISNYEVNNSRAISTGVGALGSPLLSTPMKTYPLGPRAKANFNTSIARQSLGFVPFESSIIFPALDTPIKEAALDIIVPFVPDNITPARQPEPEYKVIKPIIFTVADSTTHIAAPSAIIEGLSFNLSFIQEPETKKDDKNEEKMMRALMV